MNLPWRGLYDKRRLKPDFYGKGNHANNGKNKLPYEKLRRILERVFP
jgi:hypothetical protein